MLGVLTTPEPDLVLKLENKSNQVLPFDIKITNSSVAVPLEIAFSCIFATD
jgi:hypothetical protein